MNNYERTHSLIALSPLSYYTSTAFIYTTVYLIMINFSTFGSSVLQAPTTLMDTDFN